MLPITLILLASTCWTFGLAMQRPQWVNQNRGTRAVTVIGEGFICAVIWLSVQLLAGADLIGDMLLDGLRAGICWAVPALYSRSRYKAILDRQATRNTLIKQEQP